MFFLEHNAGRLRPLLCLLRINSPVFVKGTFEGLVEFSDSLSRAVMCDARSIAKSKEKL